MMLAYRVSTVACLEREFRRGTLVLPLILVRRGLPIMCKQRNNGSELPASIWTESTPHLHTPLQIEAERMAKRPPLKL